jgi:predicted metal-dependent HD superfamily phosphohydrolase
LTAAAPGEAELPPDLPAGLRARYAEPQRHYHSWQHIEELLALFGEIEAGLADRRAVLFAILFHDAIYDPQAHDNEEKSVVLLHQQAASLLDPATLARAEAMVLATIRHELPAGHNAGSDMAHFLDMDLAILGASPERFAEYEGQIRREYAHVPDDAFAAGRAAVLRRFAERPQLYFSHWGRARFEEQARANLAAALAKAGD